MAFTAKILSWRFRHPNIVGCLLKRRPTKGGGGVTGTPNPPSSYVSYSNAERASHYRFKSFLLTREVSDTIVSNPPKAYMSKAKASNQLGNKGVKAVRALASQQCGPGFQISVSTPYVNGVCWWFPPLIREAFPREHSAIVKLNSYFRRKHIGFVELVSAEGKHLPSTKHRLRVAPQLSTSSRIP